MPLVNLRSRPEGDKAGKIRRRGKQRTMREGAPTVWGKICRRSLICSNRSVTSATIAGEDSIGSSNGCLLHQAIPTQPQRRFEVPTDRQRPIIHPTDDCVSPMTLQRLRLQLMKQPHSSLDRREELQERNNERKAATYRVQQYEGTFAPFSDSQPVSVDAFLSEDFDEARDDQEQSDRSSDVFDSIMEDDDSEDDEDEEGFEIPNTYLYRRTPPSTPMTPTFVSPKLRLIKQQESQKQKKSKETAFSSSTSSSSSSSGPVDVDDFLPPKYHRQPSVDIFPAFSSFDSVTADGILPPANWQLYDDDFEEEQLVGYHAGFTPPRIEGGQKSMLTF